MKLSRRAALVILGGGVILLLGLVFRSFILDTFVTPLAMVFWMFWRVLISIDQVYYWALLIVVTLVYLLARSPRRMDNFVDAQPDATNSTLEALKYWRLAIMLNVDDFDRPNLLKTNLGKMLATVYTLKQPGVPFVEIYGRLKQKQIALPENIYAFLFAGEKSQARRSLLEILRSIGQAPARWLNHWRGRDLAEYYQTVADLIAFMEKLMEIDHDDTHTDSPANH